MTNRICRIYQVIEASTPRWTFEGGMREATRKALAVLRYEANERMENSQYRHFLSRAKGEEAVVLPTEDRDRIVFLLGIFCLINAYSSDGQHKEP
jgi:hypothetical protein